MRRAIGFAYSFYVDALIKGIFGNSFGRRLSYDCYHNLATFWLFGCFGWFNAMSHVALAITFRLLSKKLYTRTFLLTAEDFYQISVLLYFAKNFDLQLLHDCLIFQLIFSNSSIGK